MCFLFLLFFRFLSGNLSNSHPSGYEGLFISSVPLRRASKETPSLLCVARKMVGATPPSQQQQQQTRQAGVFQPNNGAAAQSSADLFLTRLDPTSFRILHTETDKTSISSRVSSMNGKCFLEFCHPDDQDIIRTHFLETLPSNNGAPTASQGYRITGLMGSTTDPAQQRAIRVQTRSRYIKPTNHQVICLAWKEE